MSRRARQYAVGVWAGVVVLGSGLTMWLDGSGQPGGAGSDRSRPSESPPVRPSDEDDRCPGPSVTPAPDADSRHTLVLCAYETSEG